MKWCRIFLAILLFGIGAQLSAMQCGYTTILQDDRGYTDDIPLDIAYIPSLFSVRYQMAKYGIERPTEDNGTGYEFEQLSNPVFKDVHDILQELKFDIQSAYILKLNPKWRNNATTAIVTNSCIFIDENEWKAFDNPQLFTGFKKVVQEQKLDVADPIRSIKKYVINRALVHYQNGTYRKKVASKLVVGAALGLIMAKTMPHVTGYLGVKSLGGATTALSNSVAPLTNLCTKLPLCIQWTGSTAFSILKWTGAQIGVMTLSSTIGNQLRDVMHRCTTKPYWGYLDRTAEHQAVVDETQDNKKLFVSYNASRAGWLQNNPALQDEYAWRSRYIDSMVNK